MIVRLPQTMLFAASLLLVAGPAAAVTPVTCPPGTVTKGKAGKRQWCTKPNGRRHGPSQEWLPDGKLAKQLTYRNGAKVAYTRFHSNGKRQLRLSYRGGKLHGRWSSWYMHGTRSAKGKYRRGRLEGRFTLYHFSGVRSETGLYKDNRRQGKWTFFHKNGKKAESGEYAAGKRTGTWVEYDKKGKKIAEKRF